MLGKSNVKMRLKQCKNRFATVILREINFEVAQKPLLDSTALNIDFT